MSIYSNMISLFQPIRSLLFFLNVVCLAEKQQDALEMNITLTITPSMQSRLLEKKERE